MSEVHIGTLPSVGVRVSIVGGTLSARADLHALALSLRVLGTDCDHREKAGEFIPASLTLKAVADVLEEWRRESIGEWAKGDLS